MNKIQSILLIFTGGVLLYATHTSILEGDLNFRGSLHINEPGFWFFAGVYYCFGIILMGSGVTYAYSGFRYLPDHKTLSRTVNTIITILLVALVSILGFILSLILPFFYG